MGPGRAAKACVKTWDTPASDSGTARLRGCCGVMISMMSCKGARGRESAEAARETLCASEKVVEGN